ncbi:MAG: C1 family peptidase [Elusimicrobia bacterium]|nr:C1 family peptidase [Elusimicrobiota bacterium]
MRGRQPVAVLLAALLVWPQLALAGGAAVAPVRVSAPAGPVAGYGGAALGAIPVNGLDTRLTPLGASLSGPRLLAPAAPVIDGQRAASLPLLPPTELPIPRALAAPAAAPQASDPAAAALPAFAVDRAQLQAEALAAEHGRFSAGAARARAGILATLKSLFYDQAAQAARAKEVEGIDPDWVKQMERKDRNLPERTKRRRGALQKEGFREAALNRELLARHHDSYTDELPMGRITDQKDTGRCWIFGGLNMIRSLLMSEGKVSKKFEFSENYLHFFNMLEKSNRAFENTAALAVRRAGGERISERKLRATASLDTEEIISDGGLFDYFQFLVSKYGLVPKAAMKETESAGSTKVLNDELALSLAASVEELLAETRGLGAQAAARRAAQIKKAALRRVWKILAAHLGTPPETFKYRASAKGRAQEFTPQSFAKDFAAFDPDDYVAVTSMPNQAEGAAYRVKRSAIGAARPGERRYDIRYLNLGVDRLEELTLASLRGGQPVYFSADVYKDMDDDTGIMHPGIFKRAGAYGLTKAEARAKASRQAASFLKVGGANHVMLMTGFDQPDPKAPAVKFKVENSWGKGAGDRGVYHMYRAWLRQNVYEVIVHKKFLSPAERKLWKGPAKRVSEKDIY